MLRWALMFLVLALVAGLLGFGGIAAVSANIAQILFVVFIILFIAALAVGVIRCRAPHPRFNCTDHEKGKGALKGTFFLPSFQTTALIV